MERIHLLNKEISDRYLLEVLDHVRNINDKEPITFFEIITAAAFFSFSLNNADVNILEVGLGGRLDATNVIEKNLASIISTIGFDHQDFLGNSLIKIANEKAGIGVVLKHWIVPSASPVRFRNQSAACEQ